jgi:uncharacterized protein with FMN-binding domain
MPGRKHENLAARLLLSSALVVVSVGYAWWHRHSSPHMATAEVPQPKAAHSPARATANPAITVPAMTAPSERPQTELSVPVPLAAAAPPHQMRLPSPLSALASLRMYQPPPVQTPLPLIAGTPSPGAAVPVPAGLEDGDYLSDIEQYEWGDLQVKISIHGGQITGVQMVQYPDHRAESLQISQMASPLLGSEVIKTQQAKVDVVSSATDTSYVFRDAIAGAIVKASRMSSR